MGLFDRNPNQHITLDPIHIHHHFHFDSPIVIVVSDDANQLQELTNKLGVSAERLRAAISAATPKPLQK